MNIKITPTTALILLLLLLILIAAIAMAVALASPAAPVAANLEALATVTPTVTPTPGWWAGHDLSVTPTLKKLPGISRPTFQGGGIGAAPGKPLKFKVTSCPTAGVKITGVETGGGGTWNVMGAGNIPDLQYWKVEASVDGSHWLHLYRQNGPASGLLSRVTLSTLPGQPAFFRLTAVDKTGNYPTPCTIQMTP